MAKKKPLGRDPFEDSSESKASRSVAKLIKGKAPTKEPATREVAVSVKLTPANIKQLDAIRAALAKEGKKVVSRNELIRIAITLLSVDDV